LKDFYSREGLQYFNTRMVCLSAISEEAAAVIDQINALREEMQILYDEYTKLAQFLKDKIVELGQNLNDYAKKLQEEVAENSQAAIKLETSYLVGEIGSQQYYAERQSLNERIGRNLSGLDEVKNMLTILSQIDVKPLSSGAVPIPEMELPSASPAPLSDIGEGVHDTSSEVGYETPKESAISQDVQESLPSQTGETEKDSTSAANADAVDATDLKKEPEARGDEQVKASLEAHKIEDLVTTAAESSEASSVTSGQAVQTIGETTDSSLSTPMRSEKETQGVAQQTSCTSVKGIEAVLEAPPGPMFPPVINSIQPEEALVRTETPESKTDGVQQTYLNGLNVEVVRAVKLMPYASFYDVSCPKCGSEVPNPMKSWELKGRRSKKTVTIGLFECPGCKVKFREALSKETV